MDPVTVLEVLSLVCGGSVTGLYVVLWLGAQQRRRAVDSSRQRALREQCARRNARWEPRARRDKRNLMIDVVRVARWDDREVVVEEDHEEPFVAAADNPDERMDAAANAYARAFDRNEQLT
ncbi:MAG: hypothetical protein ACREQ5_00970 [Candidatus Dormibacteria bacterium]